MTSDFLFQVTSTSDHRTKGSVLPNRREVSVSSRHHAARSGGTLQQSRDYSTVSVSWTYRRSASLYLVPLRRLYYEAELRLAETLQVPAERLPRAGESRLHGAVQSGPDHDDVRAAPGDEEIGAGRERVQGA